MHATEHTLSFLMCIAVKHIFLLVTELLILPVVFSVVLFRVLGLFSGLFPKSYLHRGVRRGFVFAK